MLELARVSHVQYLPTDFFRTFYIEYDDLHTFYAACINKIIETNEVLESIVESLRKYILCDQLTERDRDLLFGGKPSISVIYYQVRHKTNFKLGLT